MMIITAAIIAPTKNPSAVFLVTLGETLLFETTALSTTRTEQPSIISATLSGRMSAMVFAILAAILGSVVVTLILKISVSPTGSALIID